LKKIILIYFININMFQNNFLVTLIGLLVAMFAIKAVSDNKNRIKESFGMLPSMTWKIDRLVSPSVMAEKKGDFFSVPGTYQAILSPRFSNVDYGANILYNMPSYQHQGVPCDPLTFGNMAVKENYSSCAAGGPVNCKVGGGGAPEGFHGGEPLPPADYANGNYNELKNKAYQSSNFPMTQSTLPVGDMTTLNSDGETIQPIVYDRYMVANRNSRLRAHGDPIRGDLPIVPCTPEWFRPSVQPNIDLQYGAMNVIGGQTNDTATALADLVYASSGNAETAIGGVNMANSFNATLGAGGRDVNVTAFP
jgi:hypothetical protein